MKNETGLSSQEKLYTAMSSTFCMIVVLSNILSAKMFVIPCLSISLPIGLITYPLTFLLSDLVTEFFGVKKAKLMVYIALAMNLLSFAMIKIALSLPAEPSEIDTAFQVVLGLSGLRIFSSLTAYLIAQVTDIHLYSLIKKWTGPRFLWIRNNGSTCISQLIDTVVIDLIFLYWGLGMELKQVLPILFFSYTYKVFFTICSTPIFYFCVFLLEKKRGTSNRLSVENRG